MLDGPMDGYTAEGVFVYLYAGSECPIHCIFSALHAIHGGRIRERSAESLLAEIRGLCRKGFSWFALVQETFLPQFVDPSRGSAPLQFFILGSLFVLMAVVTDGLYSLLAGTLRHSFEGALPFQRKERYLVGGAYIGLGMMAAFSDTGKQ